MTFDEFKASQILLKLKPYRKPPYSEGIERTFDFGSLDDGVRDTMIAEWNVQHNEVPTLAYVGQEEGWVLLTSRRIIWSRPGDKHSVEYLRIKQLGWSSGPDGERERPNMVDEWIQTPAGLRDCKTGSPWLFILDEVGHRYEVLLERGPLVVAIWNCILQLRRLESRKDVLIRDLELKA